MFDQYLLGVGSCAHMTSYFNNGDSIEKNLFMTYPFINLYNCEMPLNGLANAAHLS